MLAEYGIVMRATFPKMQAKELPLCQGKHNSLEQLKINLKVATALGCKDLSLKKNTTCVVATCQNNVLLLWHMILNNIMACD